MSLPEVMNTWLVAERDARQALRLEASTVVLADAAFEPVPGGFSNHAWRVTASDGTRCFVRLASRQVERLGADHVTECRVAGLAAAVGLAPDIVRCDPRERLLVTRWLDEAPAGRPVADGRRMRVLATTLARLHGLAPPVGLRVVDFEAQARQLEREIGTDTAEGRLAVLAASVFDRLQTAAPPMVPCHNDLSPSNVIWDATGRAWLVDWEYAGLGDAAFDLGSLASQHGLGAQARARLLGDYVAAGGQLDAGRLDLAAWAFDYVQWLWYRASIAAAVDAADHRAAAARSGRLHESLQARASRLLRCNNAGFGA